jgi:TRAP-type C4-dicarboxylate transport system substrate-binding protein
MTLTGHYPWHQAIVANKAFFDTLPADVQAAMRRGGHQVDRTDAQVCQGPGLRRP